MHEGHMACQPELLYWISSGQLILFSAARYVRDLSSGGLFLAAREHEEHLHVTAALLLAQCLHLPSQRESGARSIGLQ